MYLKVKLPSPDRSFEKIFIGAVLDKPVQGRLEGTAAAVAVAIMKGQISSGSTMKEMRQIARMVDAIQGA